MERLSVADEYDIETGTTLVRVFTILPRSARGRSWSISMASLMR